MFTRFTHSLVSVRPRRSRVYMPGFRSTNAGIRSQGISFPSNMRPFSFSRKRLERESASISFQRLFTRAVSSVSSTPGLRSRHSATRDPFTIAFTALRLILKPSGPSMPPSVKSRSPKSESASVPSIKRLTPTFLSCTPHSFCPLSLSGRERSICRGPASAPAASPSGAAGNL